MKTFWIIVLVIIVVLGGWYLYSQNQAQGPDINLGLNSSTSGQTNTGQTTASVLSVASSTALGNYLVAANDMTLYLYTKDKAGTTTCYGDCAVKWPPYLASANEPLVADPAVTGQLTTITRADGSGEQLAYKGIPLYFWQNDKKPGDTTGQNVGKVWFVVKP